MDLQYITTLLIVAAAAFVATVTNSVAGGGTFLTFPTLTGVGGLSEKVANMTSTVGVWCGSVSAVVSVWKEFALLPRGRFIVFSVISLVGGIVGSVLLLTTPNKTFALVIPWLLLFATVIFAFSKPIARWSGRHHGGTSVKWIVVVGVIQFAIAVYGGYFGAGVGVLMLAGLAFAGLENIHQMTSLKVWLATVINGVSVVIFIAGPLLRPGTERVDYVLAGAMIPTAMLGGVVGMKVAKRIKADQLRAIVIVVGVALTGWYFYKAYWA